MNRCPLGMLKDWFVPSSKERMTEFGGLTRQTLPVTLLTVLISRAMCSIAGRGAHDNLELIRAYWFIDASSALRNEPWNAGFHYFIHPLSRLNSIYFVQRVLRKGGYAEILSRAGRTPRSGEHCRATLHRPSQQYLCRRLSDSRGDSRNDWIFERPRPHPVT